MNTLGVLSCLVFLVFCGYSSACSVSTFDFELDPFEGWTVTAGDRNASGKALLGSNRGILGAGWSFVAPAKYLGDQGKKAFVSFQLQVQTPWIDFFEGVHGVMIRGRRTEILFPLNPFPVPNTFTSYKISLLQNGGWLVKNIGKDQPLRPATMADIADVLKWITCIQISGKYSYTPHATLLDSFAFCEANDRPDWQCPTGVFNRECSGNGVCVSGVCKCNYGFQGPDCFNPSRCGVLNSVKHFNFKANAQNTLMTYYYTFTGSVIDLPEFGSVPVGSALVELFTPQSQFALASAFTDLNGQFVLKARAFPQYSYYLRFSKRFYKPLTVDLPLVTVPEFTSPVNVTLLLNIKKRKERLLETFRQFSLEAKK
eukprot:TRINITY_DN2276_c0_g1_i1.p1 TRINITY_DN2276_c0_g1~~TRINITY_DN2276_c0_g1_i1.p1  ORF type:complete len:370 (-),score=91.59 TRINITY_DN2276_c0_g1_i1:83-1192(-)